VQRQGTEGREGAGKWMVRVGVKRSGEREVARGSEEEVKR
jgi:hypothetical protein